MSRSTRISTTFRSGLIWIPSDYFGNDIRDRCISTLRSPINNDWTITRWNINAADYGDTIDTTRSLLVISNQILNIPIAKAGPFADVFTFNSGYHRYLSPDAHTPIVHTTIRFPNYETHTQLECRALIMAACRPSTNADIKTLSVCNYVLDPGFPALDPSPVKYGNDLFGSRFGVPCDDRDSFTAKLLSNAELIQCYYIPHDIMNSSLNSIY